MFRRIVPFVVAAACLTACTTELPGAARPAQDGPVLTGLAALKPCELLSPERLAQLGMKPEGQARPENKRQKVPATCVWNPVNGSNSLDVSVSPTITLTEYSGGGEPAERVRLGGLEWQVTTDSGGFSGVCDMATVYPDDSFVRIGSSNLLDKPKACELAKAAAPLVAEKLPGGEPAPPPPPPSPLKALDPCTLLTAEEVEQAGLQVSSGEPITGMTGCGWKGDEPQAYGSVVFGFDQPADQAFPAETSDGQEDVRGRVWTVYADVSGSAGQCRLVTPVDAMSYVQVGASDGCDRAKYLAQAVTSKIPAG